MNKTTRTLANNLAKSHSVQTVYGKQIQKASYALLSWIALTAPNMGGMSSEFVKKLIERL